MIIVPGQSNLIVKTGCKFSMASDDRVFTGDLNFDRASEEFVMRGVPSVGGQMATIVHRTDNGPINLMLFVEQIVLPEVRPDGRYSDFKFKRAKCTFEFATFVEEWVHDPMALNAMENHWSFVPNLVWTR